jgi:hypothetical protein
VVGVGGVGVWGVGVWGCGGGGGFPLRSNIPRSALCATLDTYNYNFQKIPGVKHVVSKIYRCSH